MFRVLETHCAVNTTSPYVETGVVGKLAAEIFGLFDDQPVNVQPVADGLDVGALIPKPSVYELDPPASDPQGLASGHARVHTTL
jgi:hypothetical protein